MIIKNRIEPRELKILRLLSERMELSNDLEHYYLNLKKGYEGEQISDRWIQNSRIEEHLILHDLLLEFNNTTFQIDTLMISQDSVYLLEIKNYEGDFFYKEEEFL